MLVLSGTNSLENAQYLRHHLYDESLCSAYEYRFGGDEMFNLGDKFVRAVMSIKINVVILKSTVKSDEQTSKIRIEI